jgi:hypothetical protein
MGSLCHGIAPSRHPEMAIPPFGLGNPRHCRPGWVLEISGARLHDRDGFAGQSGEEPGGGPRPPPAAKHRVAGPPVTHVD